jgi:hypothetical protein
MRREPHLLSILGLDAAPALGALAIVASLGCGPSTAGADAAAGPVVGTIYSGVPWLDTDGNLVNAHGVGFIQVGSTYHIAGRRTVENLPALAVRTRGS